MGKKYIMLVTIEPHVRWQDLAQAAAANSGIKVAPITLVTLTPEVFIVDDTDDNDT